MGQALQPTRPQKQHYKPVVLGVTSLSFRAGLYELLYAPRWAQSDRETYATHKAARKNAAAAAALAGAANADITQRGKSYGAGRAENYDAFIVRRVFFKDESGWLNLIRMRDFTGVMDAAVLGCRDLETGLLTWRAQYASDVFLDAPFRMQLAQVRGRASSLYESAYGAFLVPAMHTASPHSAALSVRLLNGSALVRAGLDRSSDTPMLFAFGGVTIPVASYDRLHYCLASRAGVARAATTARAPWTAMVEVGALWQLFLFPPLDYLAVSLYIGVRGWQHTPAIELWLGPHPF